MSISLVKFLSQVLEQKTKINLPLTWRILHLSALEDSKMAPGTIPSSRNGARLTAKNRSESAPRISYPKDCNYCISFIMAGLRDHAYLH